MTKKLLYQNLTLEKVKTILEELYKQGKPSKYSASGNCKTRGYIVLNFTDDWWCTDDTCGLCGAFRKALLAQIKDWADETINKDTTIVNKIKNSVEEEMLKLVMSKSKFHN